MKDAASGICLALISASQPFVWPGMTALVLLYLIAAWALITGVLEIGAALTTRSEVAHAGLLGLAGIVSVLFGLLLVVFPGVGALAVVWLIGVYSLVFGALLLGLAYRLRQAHRLLSKDDVTRSVCRPRQRLAASAAVEPVDTDYAWRAGSSPCRAVRPFSAATSSLLCVGWSHCCASEPSAIARSRQSGHPIRRRRDDRADL